MRRRRVSTFLHFLLLLFLLLLVQENKSFAEGADLQVTGLNFSNHSINATAPANTTTTPTTTTTTTTDQKNIDNSFRSEVYKMHANGLMLLHAQRARSGIETKKSSLNDKLATSGGINYHTRTKKTNETVSVNAVQENERHMEAKLGDLPQVRQRRRDIPQVRERRANTKVHNTSQVIDNTLCENANDLNTPPASNSSCSSQKKRHVDKKSNHHHHHHHHHHNHKHNHKHRHHHHHHHKHQWRSIVQGEDAFGEDVKKIRVYPEKFKKTPSIEETKEGEGVKKVPTISAVATTDVSTKSAANMESDVRAKIAKSIEASGHKDDVLLDNRQSAKIIVSDPNAKRARLKRALDLMGAGEFGVDDNPPYDKFENNQQSVTQTESREGGGDLRTRFFYDQQDRENIPPIPKIGDAFNIPKIPPINLMMKQVADNDDDNDDDMVTDTGERRTAVSHNGGISEEGDWNEIGGIRAITSPTPIPELTEPSTISSIPDITDIPTLRSIPSPEKTAKKEGKEEERKGVGSSPYFHQETKGNTTIVRA